MDQNNTEYKNEPLAADIKVAVQLAASLFGMLKAVHLYPKGHQMLGQVVKKFYSCLQEVINQKQIAVFRIFENNLYVLDIRLYTEKTPGIEDFIEEMQKRYIRQIIFNPSADLADIDGLVELFNVEPKQIAPLGGASTVLSQKGAKGIRIIEYYSRKHSTLDQERLLSLTNSIIFRYFTDDTMEELDVEQTHFLYELLQESDLVCELIKISAQFILREETSPLTETQLILKILHKIKTAVTKLDLSEEEEIKVMLKDLISSFNNEELFSLVFENPDADILKYTGAADHLLQQMDSNQTAELFVKKIADSDQSSSIIAHTKHVLGRLFIDRSAFLSFLPAFKQKLQINLDRSDKTSSILNDICSAFAPGFSLEDDVELALGTITTDEKNDIIEGLDVLKTVHIEKNHLKTHIEEYISLYSHIEVIQALLTKPQETILFNLLLEQCMQLSKAVLNGSIHDQVTQVFSFFVQQLDDNSLLSNEHKMIITDTLSNIPDVLIEQATILTLKSYGKEQSKNYLSNIFKLFSKRFISLLLRLYTQKGDLTHADTVKELILAHSSAEGFKLDINLCKEPTNSVLRLLDLMKEIASDDILKVLWPILFHENVILAHRSLKIISEQKSAAALTALLKVLDHPKTAIRIICIEYLGDFKYKEVRAELALIARGKKYLCDDEMINIDIRKAALKSLRNLDISLAIVILAEIKRKRKFLLLPYEHKVLRIFAKTQLKELKKK